MTIRDIVMFLGIVGSLLGGAFGYGQLTQKVDGMDKRLTRMENYLVPASYKPSSTASADNTPMTP